MNEIIRAIKEFIAGLRAPQPVPVPVPVRVRPVRPTRRAR